MLVPIKPTTKTATILIYTCSECGQPDSFVPTHCCEARQGKSEEYQIPKVEGRYYTEYFDDEDAKVIGKLVRASKIIQEFRRFIYAKEPNKIQKLYDSLERIYKVYRDNQYHNEECEYALGTHCVCWCGEKYHGLRGVGAIIVEKFSK